MRRVGGLIDRITAFPNLLEAARLAARGKRDRRVVARFWWNLEAELFALQEELREGTWRPSPARQFLLRDPKERMITVAPFRDRVAHHAICLHVGPVLERGLVDASYACRVGKGTHRAALEARRLACRHRYFLKADIRRYFPSIDHAVLGRLLRRVIKDRRVLGLLDRIIEAGGVTPGTGVPIGNLTSQHLANFYLGGFDHFVQETLRPGGYLRYMDDFVLFDAERARLRGMLRRTRAWLEAERSLRLKEPATLLTRCGAGLPFLGLRIFPGVVRLGPRKTRRFGRLLRQRLEGPAVASGGSLSIATPGDPDVRVQGSLGAIVEQVRPGCGPGFRRRPYQAACGFRHQPGPPRRQLEQQRPELPLGEPEQQHARQPQQQHRPASIEHDSLPVAGGPGVSGVCASRPGLRPAPTRRRPVTDFCRAVSRRPGVGGEVGATGQKQAQVRGS